MYSEYLDRGTIRTRASVGTATTRAAIERRRRGGTSTYKPDTRLAQVARRSGDDAHQPGGRYGALHHTDTGTGQWAGQTTGFGLEFGLLHQLQRA